MVPKLQARGTSFKGSTNYVLHDKKARTSERVDWILTQNLHTDAYAAYYEMYETWESQEALKKNAGVDARGRKNNKPVLHFTLSWHPEDKPTKEQMQAAALEVLQVLGLSEHQAIIAGHADKEHPHLHIVANTVHPYTGKTADLKFSKEKLSRWAEAYERENGIIRCEERVKNNEQRNDVREHRKKEAQQAAQASKAHEPRTTPSPFIAIGKKRHKLRWLDQDRVREKQIKLRRQNHWLMTKALTRTERRHNHEVERLVKFSTQTASNAATDIRRRFASKAAYLADGQRAEQKRISYIAASPLARAVYVFRNAQRLMGERTPTLKRLVPLALNGSKLIKAVLNMHKHQQAALTVMRDREVLQIETRVHSHMRKQLTQLISEQKAERHRIARDFAERSKSITPELTERIVIATRDYFRHPGVEMKTRESSAPSRDFNEAGWSGDIPHDELEERVQRMRRDMITWRARNPDRDFGLEL